MSNRVYRLIAVDDDECTTQFIRAYCKSKKEIRIRTFNCPKKCLFYIKRQCKNGNRPDAVIIDRKMPEMPGDALNLMIKETDSKIYSILYTGDGSSFLKQEKDCYGFDAVFEKEGSKTLDEIVENIKNNIK